MSEVLYEASPSMVRMNPVGMVVAILLLIGGIAVATPPVATSIADFLNIPKVDHRIISLTALVIVAFDFLVLLTWYAKTKIDRLIIKRDELIWIHGLLSKEYTEINMSSIRTVRISQTVLQRIMGAGNITVFTSGDLPEVVVKGLPDPHLIREYVKGEPRERSSEET